VVQCRTFGLDIPWPAAGQMPSLYELGVIHHPKASEVIFVADEAFVQGQVGANCVLQDGAGKKGRKEGKIRY